jgi:hypothetical protein
MSLFKKFALVLSAIATPAFAGPSLSTKDLPPPGLYEIDMHTTQINRAGPMVMTTVTETDGRTGDQTVTTTMTPSDGPPHVTRAKGSGPIRHCVGNTGINSPGNCTTVVKGTSALAAHCAGTTHDMQWRRIDALQWEWRNETRQSGALPTGWDVPAGFDVPAADAARAKSMIEDLVGKAKPEMAKLRERARLEAASSDPERAAGGRATLAALAEAESGSGGAPTVSVHRYRRIADRCTPGG